ncbi:MAG: hypothetical protein ABI399_10345 [Bauldia sp.]
MSERVLVCILSQTRAHELTWPTFKHHVLDELNADLALCIGVDDTYDYANPFWQAARFRWTVPELADYGDGFDEAQAWWAARAGVEPVDWRQLLSIRDQWLGAIEGQDKQSGSGAIQIYFRWVLYRHLVDTDILGQYDRVIVTRSDFIWPVPHPPLALLSPRFIWTGDGEHYGGITDRYLLVAAGDLLPAINPMEEIVLRPRRMARSMRWHWSWNPEKVLARHLRRQRMARRVRFFPYVMYTVRGVADSSRWRMGDFDEALGAYVKYETEYASAKLYERIGSAADWQKLAKDEPGLFHRTWPQAPWRNPVYRLRPYRRALVNYMGRS